MRGRAAGLALVLAVAVVGPASAQASFDGAFSGAVDRVPPVASYIEYGRGELVTLRVADGPASPAALTLRLVGAADVDLGVYPVGVSDGPHFEGVIMDIGPAGPVFYRCVVGKVKITAVADGTAQGLLWVDGVSSDSAKARLQGRFKAARVEP